jgi:hypothetical protein
MEFRQLGYSGSSRSVLWHRHIAVKRNRVLTSSKAPGRRVFGVDTIDIYHMPRFDATTAGEETLKTLDTLVQSDKVATSLAPISPGGI